MFKSVYYLLDKKVRFWLQKFVTFFPVLTPKAKTMDVIVQTLPDNEIVRSVLAGRKELYEIFMRRYNRLLYRTIRSFINDEQEVEDTMQETYLCAYEKLDQF